MHEQEHPNHQISSPSAGSEGRQSPGPCPFCGVGCEFEVEGGGQAEDDGPDSLSITGDHLKWCPFAASYETGATNGLSFDLVTSGTEEVQQRIANWNRRAALAAPGAPQGGAGPTAYVSPAFAPLHASEAKRRGYVPAPQEEGPAGVDLEEALLDLIPDGKPDDYGFDAPVSVGFIREVVRALRAQAPASSPRAADLEGGRILQRDMRCPRGHSDVRYTYASDTRGTIWCEECGAKHEMAFDGEIIGNALYRAWLAAHPPEDTPIEAAGLEAMMAEAMDMLENWPMPKIGNPLREEMFADRKALRVAWKAYQAAPKAGTPIEKAAREFVAATRALIEAGDPILQREMSEEEMENRAAAEDAAWTNLCVAVDGWKPDARASLSGLPQESKAAKVQAWDAEHEYGPLGAQEGATQPPIPEGFEGPDEEDGPWAVGWEDRKPQEADDRSPAILTVEILGSGATCNSRGAPKWAWKNVAHLAKCMLAEGAQEPKEGGAQP